VLVLIAGLFLLIRGANPPSSPQLVTPTLALEGLSAKSLYYNAAARQWLLKQRPELLTEEDRAADSERTRNFIQAVQNPKLFRQLDRRYRFDTLLLVGDPSQSRPLLEHLAEAKDWTLTYVDHTSMVLRRDPAPPWSAADLAVLRARFSERRSRRPCSARRR
jgi:hypothetical protein